MHRDLPAEDVSPEAADFIRFCYRRRRAGWPEIYDEMCAVAGRGLYRGWTHDDLADQGIRFSLSSLPALAAQVRRILAAEPERISPAGRGRAGAVSPAAISGPASIVGPASMGDLTAIAEIVADAGSATLADEVRAAG